MPASKYFGDEMKVRSSGPASSSEAAATIWRLPLPRTRSPRRAASSDAVISGIWFRRYHKHGGDERNFNDDAGDQRWRNLVVDAERDQGGDPRGVDADDAAQQRIRDC